MEPGPKRLEVATRLLREEAVGRRSEPRTGGRPEVLYLDFFVVDFFVVDFFEPPEDFFELEAFFVAMALVPPF